MTRLIPYDKRHLVLSAQPFFLPSPPPLPKNAEPCPGFPKLQQRHCHEEGSSFSEGRTDLDLCDGVIKAPLHGIGKWKLASDKTNLSLLDSGCSAEEPSQGIGERKTDTKKN